MTEANATENTVLVADDDPVARFMLQSLLTKWGYRVIPAADGLEAARILESPGAPQLALLDWMMPGLEGPEVCRHVRSQAERPYFYILLISARNQRGDILSGLECGADDYLTKPFDAEELRARLLVGRRILDLQNNLIATREELRFKATHDALTGVANRATALEAINRERSRQSREGSSFGVILIDVDHFKRVNDGCGHLTGDLVLKTIAERIAACVRPYDTVGRYGGEEFLVVIPLSDSADTMAIARRIRAKIEATPVETDCGELHVTVSCGIACSTGNPPVEARALLYLADEALYRAKDLGRNRCELAAVDPDVLQLLPTPMK